MAIRTLIWAAFFALTCLGALGAPIWGLVGYVGHYSVGPENQWWAGPLNALGIRYSFTLAALTAAGILLNWGKLRFGRSLFNGSEQLMLLFLGVVWLATLMSPESVGRYTTVDHVSVKLTKVLLFVMMMTHVVTDTRNLNRFLWILVVGALVLGITAYEKPYSAFVSGRLEGVGGADFSDANRFAGYMGGMLFLIGAQFLRQATKGKVIAFIAGGFTANAVVLCRSRGAFLGVFCGVVAAAFWAPRQYRNKIIIGLVLAGAGGLYLTDPQFISRMTTIAESEDERDRSALSRIDIWKGGAKMLMDNPLGVGAGNFYQRIGQYAPNHAGRDAHNTFVRCAGELGFPGLIVLSSIVAGAFLSLRTTLLRARALPDDEGQEVMWVAYGTITGFTAVLVYGLTGTLVYTEYFWWFLGLAICLTRVLDNLEEDLAAEDLEAETSHADNFVDDPPWLENPTVVH